MKAPNTCFVVMPFGRKPIPDSGGRTYDFDKVYRVILQRAIKQAGLEPMRADERLGSHMVHAEMFADLRDQTVVLADLSLLNPNVFYELGIRHVMSAAGTVLMCRQGTTLPFDVNLSRVIFYEFDGDSLDWEVVESVIQRVQAGLENAKRRQPDSPVHALLDQVLSSHDADAHAFLVDMGRTITRKDPLDAFQKELGALWKENGAKWQDKAAEHAQSPFGLRAAAHLALLDETTPPSSLGELPHSLFSLEQYDLAISLFERKKIHEGEKLRDSLRYASSLSETDPSAGGIDRAWKIFHSALAMLDHTVTPDDASPQQALDAADANFCAGAFLAWKWRVTDADADLSQAIAQLSEAQRWGESALSLKAGYSVGQAAYTRLLLLVLLRALEKDRQRPDSERHRETIFRLEPAADQTPENISYLRWYKIIALVDAGGAQEAHTLACQAMAEDARLLGAVQRGESTSVAGRQYRLLRRFIENHRHMLCHTDQLGRIAQMLQSSSAAEG